MILQQIILEMAWADKFNKIETHIRKSGMTLGQLHDYLLDQYNIILDIDIDATGTEPFGIGGAGITQKQLGVLHKDAPSHLQDKKVLNVTLGPGPDPETKVSQISGLIDVLRHELSHYNTPDDVKGVSDDSYVSPDDNPFNLAKYTFQPMERPAQALDLATSLAVMGISFESFLEASKKYNKFLYKQHDRHGGFTESSLQEKAKQLMMDLVNHPSDDAGQMYNDSVAHNKSHDLSQLTGMIGRVGMMMLMSTHPDVGKQNRLKFKGQLNAFIRNVYKNRNKIKGYKALHRTHDFQSKLHVNDERMDIWKTLNDIMRMMSD